MIRRKEKKQQITSDIMKGLSSLNTAAALSAPGEMFFDMSGLGQDEKIPYIGPAKVILNGLKSLSKGFQQVIKDKRRFMPMAILGVVWLLLNLFTSLGIRNPVLQTISNLTVANVGMSGAPTNILGGLICKGVYAYFVASFLTPLMTRENPLTGLSSAFKKTFQSISYLNSIRQVALFIVGSGAALVFYNFITIHGNSLTLIMSFITVLLSLRSMTSSNGFVRRLIGEVLALLNKRTFTSNKSIDITVSGLIMGFVVAAVLAQLPFGYTHYCVGVLLLIVGSILCLVKSPVKETV